MRRQADLAPGEVRGPVKSLDKQEPWKECCEQYIPFDSHVNVRSARVQGNRMNVKLISPSPTGARSQTGQIALPVPDRTKFPAPFADN